MRRKASGSAISGRGTVLFVHVCECTVRSSRRLERTYTAVRHVSVNSRAEGELCECIFA